PPWLTVVGGSRTYAEALLAPLADAVRTGSPVERVAPRADGRVEVTSNGDTETYDRVVLACHAPQALGMLDAPTDAEREVLGAMRYQPNDVVLHTDPSLMPRRKRAWAAWNVWSPDDEAAAGEPVRVTYWMNRLQGLEAPRDLFVSLNSSEHVDPDQVLLRRTYEHPIFDGAAIEAQRRFEEIDGLRGVHYCGAYWSYGFHEDGVQSARRALVRLGVDPRLPARQDELRPDRAAPVGAGTS
ncbi:MAG: FAD-dependent oxidoreductase, partial [Planctomycetota bacterium]